MQIKLSIIIPVYNEEKSLSLLATEIKSVMTGLAISYEVIFVDDGSRDRSITIIEELAKFDSAVRAIKLRRNYGQTAAMLAGIDHARGEILIPMDADLQNDPHDIYKFLEKMHEGYDGVSGWRKNRHDNFFSRKL